MSDANVFDALVKLLIHGSEGPLRHGQVGRVVEWLNVDLPRTQNRRVDLLGRMSDGRLLHIELQSSNDRSMAFRMAEYGLAIMRRYGEYPVQLLIYVGNARLRMTPELKTRGLVCQYRQVDVRSLDAKALLESGRIEDNILAVLAGLEDSAEGIRSVLGKIAQLRQPRREEAMQHLLVTCGIRGLGPSLEKELKTMPITMDLSHDPLFASYIKRGLRQGQRQGLKEGLRKGMREGMKEGVKEGIKEGIKEGMREGLKEGLKEGQRKGIKQVVRLQLEKRFGPLSPATAKRLATMSETKTQELALAIVDAKNLKELFASARR